MIFPGFPGVLSFFQVGWEPLEGLKKSQLLGIKFWFLEVLKSENFGNPKNFVAVHKIGNQQTKHTHSGKTKNN